jgi:hypothetical protein
MILPALASKVRLLRFGPVLMIGCVNTKGARYKGTEG